MFEKLEKYATHFSEQIKNECNHLDSVVVAGKILSIIPPITDDIKLLSSHYILELDDHVGTIFIFVSPMMKSNFDFIEVGNYLTFNGYVNVLLRKIKDDYKKDYSIVAFDAAVLDIKEAS